MEHVRDSEENMERNKLISTRYFVPFFLTFPNLFIIMFSHQGCTDNIRHDSVWCVVCVPINCNLASTLDFIEWHCTYLTHGQLFIIHFLVACGCSLENR